jgi:uncharacterized membrane protein
MGAVVSMAVESDVEAPVGLVFGYVTEWSNAPRFVVGLRAWKPLDDGPAGVGSRFEAEVGASVGTVKGELEIVRFEPDAAIEWRGTTGPQQTGGWIFTALDDQRCHVRFELAYTPRLTGLAGRVLNKGVELAVHTTLQQSANRLKEQVEDLARRS